MDLRTELKRFLESRAPSGVSFADDENLLTSGVLDSLTMHDLVEFIERRFETTVDEDEMMPENFETVDYLVRFVEQKRRQANA
jgi:acyl carrier protein